MAGERARSASSTQSWLDNEIAAMEEQLEESPDPWFDHPQGFLFKPDFKRRDQLIENLVTSGSPTKKSSFRLFGSDRFNQRYFFLDTTNLRYFKDAGMQQEAGVVDLNNISAVTVSRVGDAPSNALDLVAETKVYTLAAESREEMIRWAVALNSAIRNIHGANPATTSKRANRRGSVTTGESPWDQVSVTFEERGPLHLNVKGVENRDRKSGQVLNHWIVVSGFEPTPSGEPGQAERSGQIQARDVVIGVNDVDLSVYTFNDCMDRIRTAEWPMTLHFLRDRTASGTAAKREGWARTATNDDHKRRRRYVEMLDGALNMYRPTPGGAAQPDRECYIDVRQVHHLQRMVDLNLPQGEQFILVLAFAPSSPGTLNVVVPGADGEEEVRTATLEKFSLFINNQVNLDAWATAVSESADPFITVSEGIEEVELAPTESASGAPTLCDGVVQLKDELTNKFVSRQMAIVGGVLEWSRPDTSTGATKRSLVLADRAACNLTTAKAQRVAGEVEEYALQVLLCTDSVELRFAVDSEAEAMRWIAAMQEAVAMAPEAARAGCTFSSSVEDVLAGETKEDNDEDDGLAVSRRMTRLQSQSQIGGGLRLCEGWMYKRGEKKNSAFRKRYFVLRDSDLQYFKTTLQAMSEKPTGTVDMRKAIEVRQSTDPSAPENSLEIVTASRVYTVVPESEDDQNRWLEVLSDTLEAFGEFTMGSRSSSVRGGLAAAAAAADGSATASDTQPEEDAAAAEAAAQAEAARIEEIKSSVLHSSMLRMLTTTRLGGQTWRDRFAALMRGQMVFYETEEDMYDEDADPLGEVSLHSIMRIATSQNEKYTTPAERALAFDLRARVGEGGDEEGMRTFTFEARSGEVAHSWMQSICQATHRLTLEAAESGEGFESHEVAAALERSKTQHRMNIARAGGASHVAALRGRARGRGRGRGRGPGRAGR